MWATRLVCAALLTAIVCAFPYRHAAETELSWHLERDRLPRWPERGEKLARQQGPLRYLGHMHLAVGGLDLYEEERGQWWLVGCFGKPRRCPTGRAALAASDAMIRELSGVLAAIDENPALLSTLDAEDEAAAFAWLAATQQTADDAYGADE